MLWLTTDGGLDRFDIKEGSFTHFRSDPNNPATLTNNLVTYVSEDRNGNLWVSSAWGLNRLDPRTGRVTRYLNDPNDPYSLGDNYVGWSLEDHAGIIWAAAGRQLDALDPATGRFTRYAVLPGNAGQGFDGVTSIVEDEDGRIWLSTINNGVLRLERDRKQVMQYRSNAADPNGLRDDNVHSLYKDGEGIMWACTKAGVSRFFPRSGGFTRYQQQPGTAGGLRGNIIWSVQEGSNDTLWIGTEHGLNRLNRNTGEFEHYAHDTRNPYSLPFDVISSIRNDKEGNLWLGMYGGGVARFDLSTGRFFTYRHAENNPQSLSSDRVLCLMFDRAGMLWVATGDGGLNRMDPRTGRTKRYRSFPDDPDSLSDDNVKVTYEGRDGAIWIGTNQGLNRLDPGTGKFTHYRNTQKPGSLSSDIVDSILEDREGTLWVGTRNGLNRMDRAKGSFTTFTEKDGLPDDTVAGILEDDQGTLWLATGNGLSNFDPGTKRFRNYSESDGLAGDSMNPFGSQAACRTRRGEMVFGSTDGVTLFRPDRLQLNAFIPPVVITDFLLSRRPAELGGTSPLDRPIWAVDSLTLKPRHSIFSIEFSALSFAAPEKNRYRFRLEPFEGRWFEVDSRRRLVTYTNLPAGRYIFRVQGSNNAGVWNDAGVKLTIRVLPPWWATWWFRTLAAISFAAAMWLAYRTRVRRLHAAAAALEIQVGERTRELSLAKDAAESANRAKSSFLAAMSHELRTPLNAILGFSHLLRERGASDEQRKQLDIINRSGQHLLSLINDVLDMAKMEAGRGTLEPRPCDIRGLVHDVGEMMRVRAEAKHLALHISTPDIVPNVDADGGRLRQVLINLLNNAVTYTDEGHIDLKLEVNPVKGAGQVSLVFEVADTGPGIAPEDQARVFEPFVRLDKTPSHKGTGLGLAIARELIELMGGAITLKSGPGSGSCFRVEIPAALASPGELQPEQDGTARIVGVEPGQPECRVLVVDDEPENWMLLQNLLEGAGFPVQVAQDGAEAVEKFRQWRPAFVWMDIRMPGMDGIEAARRIRALSGGQDVKIAAVTASQFKGQRDQMLSAGFDDFVLKPYRPAEIFESMERHLGVRFVREGQDTGVPRNPAAQLRPPSLDGLPGELRAELRGAVVALDVKRIGEVVEKVRAHDAEMGSTLAGYASRYAFTKMLQLLDANGARSGAAGSE